MRLKIFLKESIIDDALAIDEPKVKRKYSDELVKGYKDIIEKALSMVKKQKFANPEAKEAIVADLLDKQEKWNNVEAETKAVKTAPSPEEKETPAAEEVPEPEEDKKEKETEEDNKREEEREKKAEEDKKKDEEDRKKNKERTEKKKENHPFYGKKNENWVTKIENKYHTYYMQGKQLNEAREIRTNTPELKYGRISTYQTNDKISFDVLL